MKTQTNTDCVWAMMAIYGGSQEDAAKKVEEAHQDNYIETPWYETCDLCDQYIENCIK